MCGCVWRYEASALFLGQLLVTQEWLICNGCCHSPAVAPGDMCTVTNAHTLACSCWNPQHRSSKRPQILYMHTVLYCAYVQVAQHFEAVTNLGFFINTHHLSPFHDKNLSCFVYVCVCVSFFPFSCEWSCSVNGVLSFLPPEHSGCGEVYPGPDEPDAGPEFLLQPVPRDGLWQAKRVQGHLQHSLQVTQCYYLWRVCRI